jgi:hypothetical protein
MKTKKIILFIVEGFSDQASLALILSKLVKPDNVRFYSVNGDITASRFTTTNNAVNKVNEHIKKFIGNNFLNKSDILKVIHLIDTDGAYVAEAFVQQADVEQLIYSVDGIKTRNKASILERNDKKSHIVDRLCCCPSIAGIAYSMYYFSCNLEHILHNECNMEDDKKVEAAEEFSDAFYGKEQQFISFINNKEFAVDGDFKETWEFIKVQNHSVNRYCNFHLFFQ